LLLSLNNHSFLSGGFVFIFHTLNLTYKGL
jgi:hypothetical protein